MSSALQIILTAIGSGAFFSFIQFLITRKDNRDDRLDEMRKEYTTGLNEREEKSKERYDEHKKAIKQLQEAIIVLTKDSQERKELEQFMSASLMAITHDKLVRLGKTYQKRGAITLAEMNNLKLLYEPYHNGLGGNSDGETYYNYCMELPVISDEEAQKRDLELKKEEMNEISNM